MITANEGEATISLYFDVEVPDELKVIFIDMSTAIWRDMPAMWRGTGGTCARSVPSR